MYIEICRNIDDNFNSKEWCCKCKLFYIRSDTNLFLILFIVHEKCGEVEYSCERDITMRRFIILIIMVILFTICRYTFRCLKLCFGCQNVQNENISNDVYQSIITPIDTFVTDEEAPPSYEQVMNNDNNS